MERTRAVQAAAHATKRSSRNSRRASAVNVIAGMSSRIISDCEKKIGEAKRKRTATMAGAVWRQSHPARADRRIKAPPTRLPALPLVPRVRKLQKCARRGRPSPSRPVDARSAMSNAPPASRPDTGRATPERTGRARPNGRGDFRYGRCSAIIISAKTRPGKTQQETRGRTARLDSY